MEAYDDYSVEHDEVKIKPARVNSKLQNVDRHKSSDKNSASSAAPIPGGLQLFDLAIINQAKNSSENNKTDDDERNARQIDLVSESCFFA
jgi:hypothetical protein